MATAFSEGDSFAYSYGIGTGVDPKTGKPIEDDELVTQSNDMVRNDNNGFGFYIYNPKDPRDGLSAVLTPDSTVNGRGSSSRNQTSVGGLGRGVGMATGKGLGIGVGIGLGSGMLNDDDDEEEGGELVTQSIDGKTKTTKLPGRIVLTIDLSTS
jgi:hypothetical protein